MADSVRGLFPEIERRPFQDLLEVLLRHLRIFAFQHGCQAGYERRGETGPTALGHGERESAETVDVLTGRNDKHAVILVGERTDIHVLVHGTDRNDVVICARIVVALVSVISDRADDDRAFGDRIVDGLLHFGAVARRPGTQVDDTAIVFIDRGIDAVDLGIGRAEQAVEAFDRRERNAGCHSGDADTVPSRRADDPGDERAVAHRIHDGRDEIQFDRRQVLPLQNAALVDIQCQVRKTGIDDADAHACTVQAGLPALFHADHLHIPLKRGVGIEGQCLRVCRDLFFGYLFKLVIDRHSCVFFLRQGGNTHQRDQHADGHDPGEGFSPSFHFGPSFRK